MTQPAAVVNFVYAICVYREILPSAIYQHLAKLTRVSIVLLRQYLLLMPKMWIHFFPYSHKMMEKEVPLRQHLNLKKKHRKTVFRKLYPPTFALNQTTENI